MKTNQLILAVAALAVFASCSNDNLKITETVDNEIGFNAVTRMATRANDAIITGATYGTENTFQVWGWQSQAGDYSEFADNAASNFMSNLTISYCGGAKNLADAWRNAEKHYYWPYTGRISFLAIHPSTVAPSTTGWDATNDVPQATIADYTITPASNETVDLMFATNDGARQVAALPMIFKHALSQIEVKVKTDEDYSTDEVVFDVESVTFNNIDLSGDVAYSNNAIAWTDNTAQTQNWVYCNTVLENINDTYQVYGAAKVNIPQPANDDKSILAVDDPNYDADDEGATLTIGYSMKQGANAKITGTVTIADPFLSNEANAWEPGKKYSYTINFRLNEILFNPSVTEWVNVNVETINIY